VLDALPGDIRAGGEGRKDHPADVIAALQALPLPIRDRATVQVLCLAPCAGPYVPAACWNSPQDRDMAEGFNILTIESSQCHCTLGHLLTTLMPSELK